MDLRKHLPGDVQDPQKFFIPVARMDVAEHGPGRVGAVGEMPGAAGQVPDQPGIDRSESEAALPGHPAGVRGMIEDPGDFGPGKVGIRNQARLLTDQRPRTFRLEALAGGSGPAVLPDDGVMDGQARVAVPDDRRFPLIGDADGGNIFGAQPRFFQSQNGDADLGFHDFAGIMLHPAGPGIDLTEFFLNRGHDGACLIKNNRPRTGRALIERQKKSHRNLLGESETESAIRNSRHRDLLHGVYPSRLRLKDPWPLRFSCLQGNTESG